MNIGGLQKLTLIDYPGHIAATVFTVGCNFRCPFCHNPELVNAPRNPQETSILEKEFFKLLNERHGKLEGICITGGEPTIQPDIVEFIEKIKAQGYKVKLDTNGMRPDILRLLYAKKMLDFVAMDIKNSLGAYNEAVGGKADIERIKLSVELIRNSGVDYEFRTTAVPGIHGEKNFLEIAKWLEGSKKYVLQKYVEGKILDPILKKKTKGKKLNLDKIADNLRKYFKLIEVR
jgi:pyruvate formate lyase activating enzyme